MLTHADFFSGLGSWAIAAANNGLKTIALCEREEWLAKGLQKIWEVPCYRDINSFPSQDYANRVWLLTGSPPCQPSSRAGKQGGAGDVRWLWPQTIRHTQIIKPTWFCYENPPGIADVGLDGIIVDLERIGYEVQPIRIPACAVDSPQDRDRFWILGHRKCVRQSPAGNALQHGATDGDWKANQSGNAVEARAVADGQGEPSGGDEPGRGSQGGIAPGRDAQGVVVADAGHGYHSGKEEVRRETRRENKGNNAWMVGTNRSPWSDYQWLACPDRDGAVKIRRAPTGLYELAHGVSHRIPRKFHSKMIAALGNAIVWQVADQIIKAIVTEQITRNP